MSFINKVKKLSGKDTEKKTVLLPSPDELRMQAVEAIAVRNENKENAHREECTPSQVRKFEPLAKYMLERACQEIRETVSIAGITEVEFNCVVNDYFGDGTSGYVGSMSNRGIYIYVRRQMSYLHKKYTFQSEREQLDFFYWFAKWFVEQFREMGCDCDVRTPSYVRARTGMPGWNEEMTTFTFRVSWADASFADAMKKINDPSQVEALRQGVPIEDIVA